MTRWIVYVGADQVGTFDTDGNVDGEIEAMIRRLSLQQWLVAGGDYETCAQNPAAWFAVANRLTVLGFMVRDYDDAPTVRQTPEPQPIY